MSGSHDISPPDAISLNFAFYLPISSPAMLQVQAKAVQTRELRQAAWFERFAWFVSSENYLVLSARDAPQADLLVKRHMRCGWREKEKKKK